MEARRFLERYAKAKSRIVSGLDEMKQLREMAERCSTEFTKNGRAPRHDLGELVARIVEAEEETERDIREMEEVRREVMRAIIRVEDARYQEILLLRYINGKTWEGIAEATGYSRQWVYKLHAQALQAVQA